MKNHEQVGLNLQHDSYVHCVAVDDTGKYLASGSADRSINIFVRSPDAPNQWEFGCTIKEHAGAVTKVAWANPQYGYMLGSIGQDMVIMLTNVTTHMTGGKLITKAVKFTTYKAGIQNSDTLTDIVFLPPRAYHTMLFAVSSLDGTVWFYSTEQQQVSRKFKLGEPEHQKSGVTSIAFSPCLSDKDFTVAVGTSNGLFELYKYSSIQNKFSKCTLIGNSITPVADYISCIAWAPPVGRPFHLIAVCSRRGTNIFRISKSSSALDEGTSGGLSFACELFACRKPSITAAWNSSGTMLAFSDDEEGRKVSWLQMTDATDHQSWVIV